MISNLDAASLRAISFDGFGALVDLDAAVRTFVAPILARATPSGEARPRVTPDAWLERWQHIHAQLTRTWRPYREILLRSYDATMQHFGLEAFVDEGPGLFRALADEPPAADATRALKRLARRHRLALAANAEPELVASMVGRLRAPFSSLVTSEEARAYKPDPRPLKLLLERLGLQPKEVLHVAASWKTDLDPARALGLRTALVTREVALESGAPELEVPSLDALAEALGS